MVDVQPLRALHYEPAVAGELADVVAPPYDVIDATQRAELLARSPLNIVAVDLPQGEPGRYAAELRGGRPAAGRAGPLRGGRRAARAVAARRRARPRRAPGAVGAHTGLHRPGR